MGDPQSQRNCAPHTRRRAYCCRAGRFASAELKLRAIQASAPGEVNSSRLLGAALLAQDKVSRRSTSWKARSQPLRDSGRRGRISPEPCAPQDASKRRARRCARSSRRFPASSRMARVRRRPRGSREIPDALFAYERARLTDPHRLGSKRPPGRSRPTTSRPRNRSSARSSSWMRVM